MTETELVATLNEQWRILYVPTPGESRSPAWHIENMDGDRAGDAFFRVAHMVLEFITAKCGPVTPEAAALLAALPARCDHRTPARVPVPRKARPSVIRDCRRCGSVFVLAKNGDRIFCSRDCKEAAHSEAKAARKAARKAASASKVRRAPKPRPIAFNEPSPEVPAGVPLPMLPEEELAETMRADQIEARLETIRQAAAAARRSLPERISAQRKRHARWAST